MLRNDACAAVSATDARLSARSVRVITDLGIESGW